MPERSRCCARLLFGSFQVQFQSRQTSHKFCAYAAVPREIISKVLALSTLCFGVVAFAQPAPSAKAIVARWKSAVHAADRVRGTAFLTTESNEDGIAGKVDEWLRPGAGYRATIAREFDQAEFVVSERIPVAERRDWNGFVRKLRGPELKRLRTAIFETEVLVFGPSAALASATVTAGDNGNSYMLTFTPPGGLKIIWYMDAATGLPLRSARSGDDSTITTAYSDWRDLGGIRTPHQLTVSETEKPDHELERASLRFGPGAPPLTALKPAPSDATLAANAAPIPFDFASAHIIFQASLNGRPPIWWILDTGADQEVINAARLDNFGLRTYGKSATSGGGNSAEYDYAGGATFTMPGVTVRNQHVAVIDQTGLEHALGMPLGGLLGYDFISRFVIEIDYEKKLLTLHDSRTWQYKGRGHILPIVFDEGIPFTDGLIAAGGERIPAYLVVDFGAQETVTLTSPFVKTHDLVRLAQTSSTVNRPAGLESQFFAQNNVRGRIDELTLGELRVSSIPINMSVNTKGAYASVNFAGTVGEGIYRRYHVFLDYARDRIIFEPTPEASQPFPERTTYGLSVLASGPDLHTYTVSSVRPGSAAEKDGFQKGDIVAALDGEAALRFTLSELRDRLSHEGEHHAIEVRRQGKEVSIAAQIKLLSLERE